MIYLSTGYASILRCLRVIFSSTEYNKLTGKAGKLVYHYAAVYSNPRINIPNKDGATCAKEL